MKKFLLLFVSFSYFMGMQLFAHGHDHKHGHKHHEDKHGHNHGHSELSDEEIKAAKGIFEDKQVKDRDLSDWYGEWQSVYPYLLDGTLDPVMESKAKKDPKKTAAEYKEYYTKGYKTDVNKVKIEGNKFYFTKGNSTSVGEYKYQGYRILNYKSGKKGARYLFSKVSGDASAPKSIQFSDHIIAPKKSGHMHLYFADISHDELLKELTNWPTYYPANLNADGILNEMLNH